MGIVVVHASGAGTVQLSEYVVRKSVARHHRLEVGAMSFGASEPALQVRRTRRGIARSDHSAAWFAIDTPSSWPCRRLTDVPASRRAELSRISVKVARDISLSLKPVRRSLQQRRSRPCNRGRWRPSEII